MTDLAKMLISAEGLANDRFRSNPDRSINRGLPRIRWFFGRLLPENAEIGGRRRSDYSGATSGSVRTAS